MNSARLWGLLFLLLGVALWMTPLYGYERATWHEAAGVVAVFAGATLLLRRREVDV